MSTKQLEKRIAKLESEFEQLKADLRCVTAEGWRAVVGTHKGSPTFETVVREMRRLRREDYNEAAEADSEELSNMAVILDSDLLSILQRQSEPECGWNVPIPLGRFWRAS